MVKRLFITIPVLICLLAFVPNAFAQEAETTETVSEEKASFSFPPVGGFFGGGLELTAYTREKVSFGGGITFGMDFILDIPERPSHHFSAGMRTSMFTNFGTVRAFEPLFFIRYYFPFEVLHIPKEEDGLFVQVELGGIMLMESGYHDYRELVPAFVGGIGVGWRFNFGEYWFFDPSFRAGYPHIWGVNVTGGFKFKGTGAPSERNREQGAAKREERREKKEESKEQDTVAGAVEHVKPTLELSFTPEYFNPQTSPLTFNVEAHDDSGIATWKLEVYQPESKTLFYSVSGRGNPPADLKWDGKGNNGETVLSGTNYTLQFSVTDPHGNTASVERTIRTDIFITRDNEGNLNIQVLSIIFRANQADFMGLGREIVESNRRIFDSVANLLNTYGDYKVIVEGHANPTTAPDTDARAREERTLQVLSEARAQRVVDELVRRGVARDRLTASGVGVSKLMVPWDDHDNNWKNRKVEFVLIKEGE